MSQAQQPIGKIIFALTLLLLLCLFLSLSSGAYQLSLSQLWQVITGNHTTQEPINHIIWQIRLPRVVAACLAGAGLSAAGCIYQGLLRNPLVSPDILGVSAGAGLGAILCFYFGLSLFWLQGMAFIGAMLAVSVVFAISSKIRQRDASLVLVLVGIAIATLLGATISLFKVLADPYEQLPGITYWLMGSLNSVHSQELLFAAPIIFIALVPVWLLRWRMDVLNLSDIEAQSLGLNLFKLRQLLLILATLISASIVSFAGLLGWIGLVIPHIARIWIGASFARLLPVSMLLGAIFLLLTDTLARNLSNGELPIGILTALAGGPFLIFVLLRRDRT